MIEFDVDMGYLLEEGELDRVILNDENGEHEPMRFVLERTCHDTWDCELTGRLRFQCSECGAVSLEFTPRFCPSCGAKVVEHER